MAAPLQPPEWQPGLRG